MVCVTGVEFLNIGAQGWVSGSMCGNATLGNIWHDGWSLSVAPQRCTMISCIHELDRGITKFPLTDQ
jgi:heat shock protein HslJ